MLSGDMWLIRPATTEDDFAADQVAQRSFSAMRQIYRPKEVLAVRINAPLARLVAVMQGSIVGTVSYETESDRLHLRSLAVDAAYRRRGVARALVERLSDLASDAQLRALSLYTIRQTGNVPMFERLGFHFVREESADWAASACGEDLSEVYMEKGV